MFFEPRYPDDMKRPARVGIRVLLANAAPSSVAELRAVMGRNPRLRVLGTARGAQAVLRLARTLGPKAVLLDLDVPALSGGAARTRKAAEVELTTRERDVLTLVAEGLSSKQIAEHLSIGRRTVETHRERLMDKLDVRNAVGLVRTALARGLVKL